jgi:hypothetical protein
MGQWLSLVSNLFARTLIDLFAEATALAAALARVATQEHKEAIWDSTFYTTGNQEYVH